MTQADLDGWISRITYKPGWTLRAALSFDAVVITVGYYGANTAGEGEREVTHKHVWPLGDFGQFVHCIIETVHELENHETREWLRVDREHWPSFLPHDPQAIMKGLRETGARYDQP